jgi:hypothetical protein
VCKDWKRCSKTLKDFTDGFFCFHLAVTFSDISLSEITRIWQNLVFASVWAETFFAYLPQSMYPQISFSSITTDTRWKLRDRSLITFANEGPSYQSPKCGTSTFHCKTQGSNFSLAPFEIHQKLSTNLLEIFEFHNFWWVRSPLSVFC